MPAKSNKQKRSILVSIICAALFSALTIGSGWLMLQLMPLEQRVSKIKPFEGYQPETLQQYISPESVKKQQDKIVSFGSRYLGQDGFYQTANYIRQQFDKAGLQVLEMTENTTIPQTEKKQIQLADGQPMPQVEIYPLMPNHIQPMVTPPEGLQGELLLLTDEVLESRSTFEDCIGLLNVEPGQIPESLDMHWVKYAQLGLKGIIISHKSKGLEGIPWEQVGTRFGGMVASDPINYVRLIANEEIFDYAGQKIRLDVKTVWGTAENTTFIGVLRAGQPSGKALVIHAHYDATSNLPDLGLGVNQAVQPAVLMQLVEGLSQYKDTLTRDIIFVARSSEVMAASGVNRILSALDWNIVRGKTNPVLDVLGITDAEGGEAEKLSLEAKRQARLQPIVERENENQERWDHVKAIQAILDNPDFLNLPQKGIENEEAYQKASQVSESILEQLPGDTQDFFNKQYKYVLNTLVLAKTEGVTQGKAAIEKFKLESGVTLESQVIESDVYKNTYVPAKKEYDDALNAAGYGLGNLIVTKHDYIETVNLKKLLKERFLELDQFHEKQAESLKQDEEVIDLFNPYSEIFVVEPKFMPAYDEDAKKEVFSFNPGSLPPFGTQSSTIVSLLSTSRQRLGIDDSELQLPEIIKGQNGKVAYRECDTAPFQATEMWCKFGYPAVSFVNFGRLESYRRYSTPIDLPYMHNIESLRNSLALFGETVLALGHGLGEFKASTTSDFIPRDFKGRVLVSNVGQSVVPNYPLKHAIITSRGVPNFGMFAFNGFWEHYLIYTDPYGEFDLPNNSNDFLAQWLFFMSGQGYSPIAAAYDQNGMIAYMKDEGEEGQRLYKSVKIPKDAKKWRNITIVTFRATPVTLVDMTNPQTMQKYSDVELYSQKTKSPFIKHCIFNAGNAHTTFIDPTERFYVTLKGGIPGNEFADEIRAFMLNIKEGYIPPEGEEIPGPGYLASATPMIYQIGLDVARSMTLINGLRLELQERRDMSDKRTEDYHSDATSFTLQATAEGLNLHESRQLASKAVTYATLNHPVIRESITEAVWGIIWYLGLVVPFCFFFEKLVFGYPDIRKQITAITATFLIVFALLRYLHPAFEMVRSPLMILLGFVIIMISAGITILFATKFRENLEELRKSQGKVTAAEINVLGAVASAFMLGLNNMHRRKVRTGLTCITLILMTFVMISFSSVQSDLVDEQIPLGKAPYQGILIKKDDFRTLKSLGAIQQDFKDQFPVAPRTMVLGSYNASTREKSNPDLVINYEGGELSRKVEFNSIVKMHAYEPLRAKIKFLTDNDWFTSDDMTPGTDIPVFLPDRMAASLGIRANMVNDKENPVKVRINGRTLIVKGIFDSASYAALRDIDGVDLLPYDMEAMDEPSIEGTASHGEILATPDEPRIEPYELVICPYRNDLGIRADGARQAPDGGIHLVTSVAVVMDKGIDGQSVARSIAKDEIDYYLERKAEPVYYGLDNVAYQGKRARESSVQGILELLIPLLIAALTVLNTMKGSVYERRDEIFVYNAVGIAPRYVFAMFFAEAIVYAVVGSVLGYILSQGVGRILIELDMTHELKMTFTSIMTIYASIAIALSVFISTLFPALSAMEIAAPAEDSGWKLPDPEGDSLRFRLPFTFNHHDRIAVLSFFQRYLHGMGEGSSGRFFAGDPEIGLSDELDPLAENAYIPELKVTTWLKPFDLAVSQDISLTLPTDDETGEYIAEIEITRLSGTREAWLRLNKGFVALIRRQFLHWRAVPDEDRKAMFVEAKEMLHHSVKKETQVA